jgi:hypothetical protein
MNLYDREKEGKERTMHSGPTTANQVRDWAKRLKQKFLQMKSVIKKYFL